MMNRGARPAPGARTSARPGADEAPRQAGVRIAGGAGDCYWEINSDPNGGQTVANDTVTGGRPTVRLTAGQFFTTKGCGDWTTP